MCIRVGMYTEVYVKVMVSESDVAFRSYWWENNQIIYDRPGIVNSCCFRDIGSNEYYYYDRHFIRR